MLKVINAREVGKVWMKDVKSKLKPEKPVSRLGVGERADKVFYDCLRWSSSFKLIPFKIVEPQSQSSLVSNDDEDRQLVKFKKSWEIWLYYAMTLLYIYGNVSRMYTFVMPIAKSGRLKIDLYFAGDMFFFAANGFSAVFKTALALSSNDLIFLVNETEKSIGRMRRSLENLDPEKARNRMQKYCWYFSMEGLAGIWSTVLAGIAAQLALTVVVFFSVDRTVNSNWDIVRIVFQFGFGVFISWWDVLLSMDSCFIVTVLIISSKIQLIQFESFCELEDVGTNNRSKLQKFFQHYKRLQVFNAYGNGYFRVLFPGYIGILQADVIALLYVSLTGHKFLPILIYWTFPVASAFIFFILICLLLSQVGNIFRQSQEVGSKFRHELLVEFLRLSSNSQHMIVSNNGRILEHVTTATEKLYLWKCIKNIRPYGFYSGFYGAIDQKTPASMTCNICNCLILLLSYS